MKELYRFTETIDGKELSFILKKPSRTEVEDSQVFEAAAMSKFMNQGLQTRAVVDKYYADNSPEGIVSKADEKRIVKLRQDYALKYEKLSTFSGSGKKANEKRAELYEQVEGIERELQELTSYYATIYDNTADVKARNKKIDFDFLNLSYIAEGDGDPRQIFPCDDEDFSKRMVNQFDQLEERQEGDAGLEWSGAFEKLILLFTAYYFGSSTVEEFDSMLGKYYEEVPEEDLYEEVDEIALAKEEAEAEAKAEAEKKK